jgi:hypothetical protein
MEMWRARSIKLMTSGTMASTLVATVGAAKNKRYPNFTVSPHTILGVVMTMTCFLVSLFPLIPLELLRRPDGKLGCTV